MKKDLNTYTKTFRILSLILTLIVIVILLITYINSDKKKLDENSPEETIVVEDVHNIENWNFKIPYNYNVREQGQFVSDYFKVFYIPRKGKYEVYISAGNDFEKAKQKIQLAFDNFQDLRNVQEKNIIFYDSRHSYEKIDDFSDIKDF